MSYKLLSSCQSLLQRHQNVVTPVFSCQLVRQSSGWKFWSKGESKETSLEPEPLSEVDMMHQQEEEYRRTASLEAIQLKRNKSRLSASHRQMIRGQFD